MNFLARVKVAAAVSRPLPSFDFSQEGRCVLRLHFRYPIIHSTVLHSILPLYGRFMSALHLEVSAMSRRLPWCSLTGRPLKHAAPNCYSCDNITIQSNKSRR